MVFVVENVEGPVLGGTHKDFEAARRKACRLSRDEDDVFYVVAVDGNERIGHRVYANGRFLREEGRGF